MDHQIDYGHSSISIIYTNIIRYMPNVLLYFLIHILFCC